MKETTKSTTSTMDVNCMFQHIHPLSKIGRLIKLSELHGCLIKENWNTGDTDECGYNDGIVDYSRVMTETRTLIEERFPDNDLAVKSRSCHQTFVIYFIYRKPMENFTIINTLVAHQVQPKSGSLSFSYGVTMTGLFSQR
jgi:hypothetical protein